MKKLALGLVALSATFYSCSSDDATGNEPVNPGTGQTAYLAINITDANQLKGRIPGGYEDGVYRDNAENKVNKADFYFYDEKGNFVTKANIWTGGDVDDPADENIEYIGNNVLVLQGLSATNMPNYMVTVLNNSIEPANTLEAMEAKLAATIGTKGNFVMTTTSYFEGDGREDKKHDKYYFTTVIPDGSFIKNPTAAKDVKNPVKIYVERLAAKVELDVDNDKMKPDDNDCYTLNVTLAGDDNTHIGDTGGAGEQIKIKFLGYDLTSTSKNSYLFKNLDYNWNTTAPFTSTDTDPWNNKDYKRSHWAKSVGYNSDEQDNALYDYIKADDVKTLLGNPVYCAENTNTATKLKGTNTESTANHLDRATHIVLKAQIITSDNSDFVRYNGILFTKDRFKNYVLSSLTKAGTLNAWSKEGNIYTRITAGQVDVVSDENSASNVHVELTTAAPNTWYKINENGKKKLDEDGNIKDGETFSDDDFEETTQSKDVVNGMLAGFDPVNKSEGFEGGLMYYTIPIEHWIKQDWANLTEGMYGVVRNHYYKVTVTKLTKLGTGIYDPTQGIVPPPTPGGDSFGLGAQINILSWKIISQSVEL